MEKSSSSLINPPSLSGDEIREAFINFFVQHNHKKLASSSLIPDDPTVLLTIAGMLPFKPIFLGLKESSTPRATSSQKCIRTNDIENVGRTARHHTFFEMLGNFSFGDYFKKEAIQWAWELSTEVFRLNPQNIVISVFKEDLEAEQIWKEVVGVDAKRIIRMDASDNFWSSGATGPCGPCSELYFDFKPELGSDEIDLEDDSRFIEFYNLVFMQYNRDLKGNLEPLANCHIDTGMGLERMAQILQKKSNNYETDLIFPLIKAAALLAQIKYETTNKKNKTSLKIIGDHCRAVTHLICDGVSASNLGRGYILRRLIRRMIRHGRLVGIIQPFLPQLAEIAIELMKNAYPQLLEKKKIILNELKIEESRFLETLERGEKLLAEITSHECDLISGAQAFELYDTYGFPLELTEEIANEKGISVDINGFENEMAKQRKRAKEASVSIDLTEEGSIEREISLFDETRFEGYEKLETTSTVIGIFKNNESVKQAVQGDLVKIIVNRTPFYAESGGQIGDKGLITSQDLEVSVENVRKKKNIFIHSGIVNTGVLEINSSVQMNVTPSFRQRTTSNHTATHLLQSALKLSIDSSVSQRGSLVSNHRLRFDFNAPKPLTIKELEDMEVRINQWINEDHPIQIKTMPIKEAMAAGALAMFGEKYGDVVRVVDVPGVSMELCGGTHVTRTSQLGTFKIINETGIASGIRRIEAIAGPSVLDYFNERDLVVKELSKSFKVQSYEIVERVSSLQLELKDKTKELIKVKNELALAKALGLASYAKSVGKSKLLIRRLDGVDGSGLQSAASSLIDHLGKYSAVIFGGIPNQEIDNKLVFVAAFSPDLVSDGLHAGKFISGVAKMCGGGGGGRPNLAQAGGSQPQSLDLALEKANDDLTRQLS